MASVASGHVRTACLSLCMAFVASGCSLTMAAHTRAFADVERHVKVGDAVTVVEKNDQVTTGRIEGFSDAPTPSITIASASGPRTFMESAVAKIERRERRPLQGLGLGVAAAILLPIGASEGHWVPPGQWWPVLIAAGGVAGLVEGTVKRLRTVYEYATLDVLDPALPPVPAPPDAAAVLSTHVDWHRVTPQRDPRELAGRLELDFGYHRLLLRIDDEWASSYPGEVPVGLSVNDVQVVCDEQPEVSAGDGPSVVGRVDDVSCAITGPDAHGEMNTSVVRIASSAESPRGVRVVERLRQLLGDRLTVATMSDVPRSASPVSEATGDAPYSVGTDERRQPFPQPRPDQALVVVVCPEEGGSSSQFRLYANDQLVAINQRGTYSAVYLDPGDYELLSESVLVSGLFGRFHSERPLDASTLSMTLEAGEEYYFLQERPSLEYGSWDQTVLMRHAKAVVAGELQATRMATWARNP